MSARTVTWADLEPDSVEYAEVALTRKVANTHRRTREDAESRDDALRWLCANSGQSLMGLGPLNPETPAIRAVVLDQPLHLLMPDGRHHFLPMGTDLQAIYANGHVQQMAYDLPDSILGIRATPPFCARMHKGKPLLPDAAVLAANAFTVYGQVDVLMAMRAAATQAGADGHIADIDKRLTALTRSGAALVS